MSFQQRTSATEEMSGRSRRSFMWREAHTHFSRVPMARPRVQMNGGVLNQGGVIATANRGSSQSQRLRPRAPTSEKLLLDGSLPDLHV